MWIDTLDDEQAAAIFGKHATGIVELTKEAARAKTMNEAAVTLFVESLREVAWRRNEGAPLPAGAKALARARPLDGRPESKRWNDAVAAAERGLTGALNSAADRASAVAGPLGGHHFAQLAGLAALELAQPARDLHFFLELAAWARAGHWPWGWDDGASLPLVW